MQAKGEVAGKSGDPLPRISAAAACWGTGGAGGLSSLGGAPYGNISVLLAMPLVQSLKERRRKGREKKKDKGVEESWGMMKKGRVLGRESRTPALPGPGGAGGPRCLSIWVMVDGEGGNAKAPLPSAGNGTQRDLATPLLPPPPAPGPI